MTVVTDLPIQNNLSKLFWLVNYACPKVLGNIYQFKEKFIEPIEEGSKANASVDKQRLKEEQVKELDRLLQKCLIRRTKSEIESKLSV